MPEPPTIQALLREVAQLQAVEAARQHEKLRTRTSAALAKAGLDPASARRALALLVDSDERITWADDGPRFRDDSGELLDLEAGVTAWMQTDDGRVFAPAPPAPEAPAAEAPAPPTRAEIGAGLLSALGVLPRPVSADALQRQNIGPTVLNLASI